MAARCAKSSFDGRLTTGSVKLRTSLRLPGAEACAVSTTLSPLAGTLSVPA